VTREEVLEIMAGGVELDLLRDKLAKFVPLDEI